jgi:hypothetical protein
MPKGLPPDVSPLVKQESDGWGEDGHSHSYFTLKELKDYNWQQYGTKLRGWVGASGYQEFKKKGYPENYCGGVSGANIRHLSNEDMEKEIEADTTEGAYTQVEWAQTYAECAEEFLTQTIPRLEKIRGDGERANDEHVRIVFWFDN